MSNNAFKLVIFDCDGVLVDSEPIANRTFAEEVRKLGIPFSDQEAQTEFPGTTLAKCIEYVEKKFQIKLPEDIGPRFRARSFINFTNELKPVEGVKDILDRIKIPTCVASNGPKNKMIHNLGIVQFLSYFEEKLYSAYDIQRFKPDPGIFLHAADQLGVSPRECIVVEDSIHGFEAGLAAGMKVFGYAPHHHINRLQEVSYFSTMLDLHNQLKVMGLLS